MPNIFDSKMWGKEVWRTIVFGGPAWTLSKETLDESEKKWKAVQEEKKNA